MVGEIQNLNFKFNLILFSIETVFGKHTGLCLILFDIQGKKYKKMCIKMKLRETIKTFGYKRNICIRPSHWGLLSAELPVRGCLFFTSAKSVNLQLSTQLCSERQKIENHHPTSITQMFCTWSINFVHPLIWNMLWHKSKLFLC